MIQCNNVISLLYMLTLYRGRPMYGSHFLTNLFFCTMVSVCLFPAEGHALAVQLRALNTTAILVTWHPITLHSKVDQVTGFKVTYRKVSADQSDAPATATLSLPRSARQHVIARLGRQIGRVNLVIASYL